METIGIVFYSFEFASVVKIVFNVIIGSIRLYRNTSALTLVIFKKSQEKTRSTTFLSLLTSYSARCIIGSRIIESPAYCNQILLARLDIIRAQSTSVN